MLEGNAAIPRCWVCRGARTACTSPLHQCWTRQCHCPPPALPWGCSSSPVHGFGTRACRAVTDPSTTAETWEEWVCWLQVVRHQLFDCSGYSKGCRYQLGCEVVVHLHPRAVKASVEVCVHQAAWHLAALARLAQVVPKLAVLRLQSNMGTTTTRTGRDAW